MNNIIIKLTFAEIFMIIITLIIIYKFELENAFEDTL